MKLKLKMTYKEFLANKDLKAKLDNIALDLTILQYDFGDENTFGKLITSDLANRINDILPLVIPEEQYNAYSNASNNIKRKQLIKGVFGAFRNKLVFDKATMSKKSTKYEYYSELKIAGWDLIKQIYLAMIHHIEIDKTTKDAIGYQVVNAI